MVPTGAAGRHVAEPAVEFRLPDGSAIAHLPLAGNVQAMIAASGERELQGLNDATAAGASGLSSPRAKASEGEVDPSG